VEILQPVCPRNHPDILVGYFRDATKRSLLRAFLITRVSNVTYKYNLT